MIKVTTALPLAGLWPRTEVSRNTPLPVYGVAFLLAEKSVYPSTRGRFHGKISCSSETPGARVAVDQLAEKVASLRTDFFEVELSSGLSQI